MKLGINSFARVAVPAGRQAFTLIEVLVASSIATFIMGATLLLLLESAQENRRGYADATVEEAAAGLEGQLLARLRVTSANEGIIFASPSSIIFARGPAPDFPREQISFDATAGTVYYYSNRLVLSNGVSLYQNRTNIALRQLTFSPSIKPDGTTNAALINVLLKLDDNGSSGRSPTNNPASIWRTFAVDMRNH